MEGAEEGGGGGVEAVMTESALSRSDVRAATQRSRSGPFCKENHRIYKSDFALDLM